MPEISEDTAVATAYPPQKLYNNWTSHADDLDLTISQFMVRMVESGRRNIQFEDAVSDSVRELRRQREDLKEELERQRERVAKLERQLHRTAHTDIVEFVSANPGTTSTQITQHVANTVPGRVASHLDVLEGDLIQHREDGYYPLDSKETEVPEDFAFANVDVNQEVYE